MLTKLHNKLSKNRFFEMTKGILDTAPMPVKDADWSIISMVSNSDVQMYLLAMKSFYAKIGRGKITVIVDRNMPEQSRAILRHHLPGIRFVHLEDIDSGDCQRGGTWERLVYLLDQSEREYVIQIDCDTLTFGDDDIKEVIGCIQSNVAFTLSNYGRPIRSMPDAAEDARATDSDYVGILVERLFDRYPNASNRKYVRASSGFAGFAKGAFPRREIEDFHRNMEKLMGADWKRWGTEQNGSNYAVANSPNAVVLPYPKYANFWPGMKRPNTFIHFIGSHRYEEDYFASTGQSVVGKLKEGEHTPASALSA